METLYKEMQERLKYLEEQEQTEEIKIRINEITLAIVRVGQLRLRELVKNSDYCQCAHPTNTFDGTQRCVTCRKKLTLSSLMKLSEQEKQGHGINQFQNTNNNGTKS